MREYIFRGKRTDGDGWVIGRNILQTANEGGVYIVPTGQGLCGMAVDGSSLNVMMIPFNEVYPETVGQFTGLTDKNGKKVFEGDILEYTSYTGTGIKEVFRAIVFWDEHRWSYKVIYNNRWTAQWNNKGYTCDIYKAVAANFSEVIGNIHDNPELLKGE